MSVLLFLAYSIGYLCFVAWASEKAKGAKLSLSPKVAFLFASLLLPGLLLLTILLSFSP